MTLVNNNANNGMVFPQLAALPQNLPQTQGDWQMFLNAMAQWQQAVALQPAFQANQSADADPTHASFNPGTIYQQSSLLLGLKLLWVQPVANTYFKIATLPPTSLGTLDSINIRATLNGTWAANTTTLADIILGNRNTFTYQWNRVGAAQTNVAIAAYTEADGSVSVYAVGFASFFSYAYVSILNGGDGAAVDVVLYPTPKSTTSPTGTLVFNTANEASYPPTGISSMLSGNNTWTGTNTFEGPGVNAIVAGTTNGWILGVESGEIEIAGSFAAGGANSKSWYQAINGTQWSLNTLTDVNTFGSNAMVVTRSGTAITGISLGTSTDKPPISLNGKTSTLGPVAGTPVDITGDEQSVSVALVGFSTVSTATIEWSRNGNQVTVFVPVIFGTSNSTGFTLAIPAAIQPARTGFGAVPNGLTTDNGANVTDCSIFVNTAQFQFYHNFSATGWTAAGNKGSGGFFFSYLLN